MLEHAKLLESLTEKLAAEGIRIFFFEVPYPSQLNESLYPSAAGDALAQVIGTDDRRRLTLRYPENELRSEADGIHLDYRSPVIFAAALNEAIHERLAQD
jgi:hypothetical protein